MESSLIERAARLRAAGLSYAEVADALGCSRQHVHRLLADVTVPRWAEVELRTVYGGYALISPETDPRIIHALLKHALLKAGVANRAGG